MTPDEHREIRHRLGLNQSELAELLGVRVATISDRERGVKPILPDTALLLRYMNHYGLAVALGEEMD